MSESLRDQLLKSGLVQTRRDDRPRDSRSREGQSRGAQPREDRPREDRSREDKPREQRPARQGEPASGSPRRKTAARAASAEIDLARAYALRAEQERAERVRAEREAAARAAARKAQRQQLLALLDGRALNREDAEHVRHFEYGGKIRRVYVSAEQLREVNDGVLGVIQCEGRYLLVPRALAEQVRVFAPAAVALLAEPGSAVDDLSSGDG
jgi:uncharacterized protein YaiL (DUF2058 family)